MNNMFRSKLAVGIVFFCLGFLTSQVLTRLAFRQTIQLLNSATTVQTPVNPNNFDHDRLLDAVQKMKNEMLNQPDVNPDLARVERKEDEQFVYYEIPLTISEQNDRELKINIGSGIIRIIEHNDTLQTMREFAIEPGLDESRAKVSNHEDKLSVKFPKKATI